MEHTATLRNVAAFVRQDFLSQTSYRVQTILALGAFLFTLVPVYFIAEALQPMMAGSIQDEGDQYFAFLIVGMAAHRFIFRTMSALPTAASSGIRTGTLEALFTTPTSIPALLGGMIGYRVLWGLLEAGLLVGAGWAIGAHLVPGQAFSAMIVGAVLVAAYLPFGILATAGILAFRTAGPVLTIVNTASLFLGGVYYPTRAIPSWIEGLSEAIPLTYGLRALRHTLLEGMPLHMVAGDLLVLSGFSAVLGTIAVLCFQRALLYARRSGSLAQY